MAFALGVNGQDQTAHLLYGSLTLKYNTADFALIDPASLSPSNWLIASALQVTIVDSSIGLNWQGTLTGIEFRPASNKVSGHMVIVCTATNSTAPVSNTAPFDLSDVAHDATDLLTTEAGDELITETGAQHIMTEGPRAVSYSGFSIRSQSNLDTSVTYYGRATIWQPGLVPGHTWNAQTSMNADITNQQGVAFTLAQFVVNEVTTTWPGGPSGVPVPAFLVEFGASTTPQTFRAVIGLP